MWHGFRDASPENGITHLIFHLHENIPAESVSLDQLLRPEIALYIFKAHLFR